jgi:hypothetical protein
MCQETEDMSRLMGLSYIWVNLVLVNGETNAVILLWHYLRATTRWTYRSLCDPNPKFRSTLLSQSGVYIILY